ncbi:MAG: hypothetical protein M5U31_07815 [Acidimicrobiia bacterium]|nr:hypothetical protein [Acidimicrobiia bacterium]
MVVIRTLVVSLVTAGLTVAGASAVGAAPGDLDDTFGGDGIAEIPNATANADANGNTALAVGADSKLVQAGVDNGSGSDDEFIVVRYLDDGSPDPTFDGDGVARIADTTRQADVDGGVGVAVDSGNKPILGGVSVNNGGEYFLARFGDSGGLDATYGAGAGSPPFRTQRSPPTSTPVWAWR